MEFLDDIPVNSQSGMSAKNLFQQSPRLKFKTVSIYLSYLNMGPSE